MWEKELKLIENLGKLYPEFNEDGFLVEYGSWQRVNYRKAWWVCWLCKWQLNRRILQLEKFVKSNNGTAWVEYRQCFRITDEQCGKKS